MSGGDPTDDVAGCNIKCCVQTGGAVPRVVVRAPLHLSWTKLEQRLRAIQGLHLRLLIHAENQRVVRRIQIEADDVDDFLGESRVVAHLECSQPMRFEVGGRPDFAHLMLGDARMLRHQTEAPVRRFARDPFDGHPQDLFGDLGGELTRLSGSRTVVEAIDPVVEIAMTPLVDTIRTHAHHRGNVGHGDFAGREEEDARAVREPLANCG